ncbi:hypothetical protein Pla175_40060 [Pirellulimonas nuda]|uniref:VWFA domain-containing protein n=1 Tax=Pirellulimonas nuda TaxID=2528009 RepID=A0A518DGJ4_9BACT|nr:BatA and WFA domain-containing protein [Pirellulimonas nuda]QDU90597.1 hypothetical protein Pla175_40060 [Pirellulimonas nuda]
MQWAAMAAVPAVIFALYFLKLKRAPVEVPSTYLWRKSIEDLRVNSLWQRLRQSLLLFLQLLLALLAILAVLRPGWEGTDLSGQRFIFLVDNSASMGAADVEGAKDRLEVAKQQVTGLIDQMDRGMTAMLVSFAGAPRVVQEFTDNTRLLKERLATIEPTDESTDLLGALKLADGLANPAQQVGEGTDMTFDVADAQAATLFIMSDGRFSDVKDFQLGNLEPVYVPIGSTTSNNLAITALSTRRNESRPEERQAFVQVTNFTDEPRKVIVEVQLDGALLDAQSLEVPAGEARGAPFPLADAPAGRLEARLAPESTSEIKDVLAVDNRAYAPLNDMRPGRVLLVTPGNFVLEAALATGRAGRVVEVETASPEVLKQKKHQDDAQAGLYDLIVYDRCAPETMPRCNTLMIGALPPTAAWQEGLAAAPDEQADADADADAKPAAPAPKTAALPQIIDWSRIHPLMTNVELDNVDIVQSLVLTTPRGGATLIDSTAGPLLVAAPRESYEDAVLGFDILTTDAGEQKYNTNWPKAHSFPTFWLNALNYFVARSRGDGSGSVPPGATVELRPAGVTKSVVVTSPGGETKTLTRLADEPFQFHDTQSPGVYEVADGGRVIERFAVNLFDRAESDVRLRPASPEDEQDAAAASIQIGNTAVAAAGLAPRRKELWPWILTAALVLLLFEWYVYNRRVYF